MEKDRRLWWRIVTGCILLLAVAVNLLVYVALKWANGGDLVRMRPDWVADLTYTGTGPMDLIRKEVDARLEQVGSIEAEHRGGIVRVTMPFGSQEAYEAREAYEAEIRELESAGVDVMRLRRVLGYYAGDIRQAPSYVDQEMAALATEHPAHAERIAAAAAAYRRFEGHNKALPDPDQLVRMLNRGGRLEFRIAPTLPGTGGKAELTEALLAKYLDELANEGPEANGKGRPYVWLPMREGQERLNPKLVSGQFAGRRYLLLANRPEQAMLQRPGSESWSVQARPGADDLGRPAVSFHLDSRGGTRMAALTTSNREGFLAIVVDDEVYSAPVIRATIGADGIITGQFTRKEIADMVQILNQPAAFGAGVRFSLASVTTRGGGDPPMAGRKRVALWAIAAAAAALLAAWLVAMPAGRLHLACLWALLVPLSGIAFWQIVRWNNLAARGVGTISPLANGVVATFMAGIWILAASFPRRHRPPELPVAEQPPTADK